jgi:hypothetical protein
VLAVESEAVGVKPPPGSIGSASDGRHMNFIEASRRKSEA